MLLSDHALVNKALFARLTAKRDMLRSMLASDEFRARTGLDFPEQLTEYVRSGSLYKSDTSLDRLCRESINFHLERNMFGDLGPLVDRHYENQSLVETLVSTSLRFLQPKHNARALEGLKWGLFGVAQALRPERFGSFSILQINEFNFPPLQLRVFWQFEAVFSLLMYLCAASPACAAKVVFLYFEHFDLLFKYFEDVFLFLHFPKTKKFEVKKVEKPVRSRLGGFFKTVTSMLTQAGPIESENEIFIRQKHRGNIKARNKNSHLLRNFISSVAPDFTAFKNLLDGLQFALFGVGNRCLAREILFGLELDSGQLCGVFGMGFDTKAQWLKGDSNCRHLPEGSPRTAQRKPARQKGQFRFVLIRASADNFGELVSFRNDLFLHHIFGNAL